MTIREAVKNRLVFYSQVFSATKQVGAFSLTSRAVAEAVAEPVKRRGDRPLRVLELGAGTGPLTRAALQHLRKGDRLDLYEINPEFARYLRDTFGNIPDGPEVRVFEEDVELIPQTERYDVIISSLPLLNFPPEKVRRIFDVLEKVLEPDGTISYYDYWAKELRALVAIGPERKRMMSVLRETKDFWKRMQYDRKVVWGNVPPGAVHRIRHRATT